ncbi:MAG: proton-conducting membrane transporter [Defluviitaleaceae bacterium]|nr:proton-conducting membrane transporter [Defluviitaleaceae bacterium]
MYVDYLSYFVIIPVLIAVFLFVFSKNKSARVIAIGFQAIFTGFVVFLVMQTRGDNSLITAVGNYDGILGIMLFADNMSAVFVLLTSLLFLGISIYSFHESDQRRFWCLLFLLEAALVGLFLTRDLFNIFVMVEVSTVVVIILMMYYRTRRNMFTGMVYLMVNIIAMQLYLFGLAYIYMIGGGFDIPHLQAVFATMDQRDLILPYAMIMTGIAFKAGIIPLISVIPKARLYPGAPSAVAALLSGIQVKTAVYLFIRFQDMFGGIAQQEFFLVVGIITAATGVIMAMAQKDIKMILAYHTVSQVGLIMIGLNAGDAYYYSHYGALYHMVAHGIFKSALFLTAGIIRKSYGTANVYKIRGVLKRMPVVGIASAFAILSITGAPFFIGSISKYFLTAGNPYGAPPLVEYSIIIVSVGTIISFIKYGWMLFGKDPGIKGEHFKPDKWRVAPSVFLALLCLGGGLFGVQIMDFFFNTGITTNLFASGAYYQKAAIFAGSAAIGFVLYKFVVSRSKVLVKIGEMDLTFKTIAVSTGAFLGIMLIITGLMT